MGFELTEFERDCLQVLMDEYRQYPRRAPLEYVAKRLPKTEANEILLTFEKLATLHLVRLYKENVPAKHPLMTLAEPTGEGQFFLEGRLEPTPPGQLEVVVRLDPQMAAQLCDAVGALHAGQQQLTDALATVADAMRQPRASTTEKLQLAIGTLTLLAETYPLVKSVVLPLIHKFMAT